MTEQKCTLCTDYHQKEIVNSFLSTTWCRDRLFTSEDPSKIRSFYDTFHSREDIIEWMRERPKGRAEIKEVEGNKETIVVIPTANYEGRFSRECRENIFKGIHTIFVESGSPRDPYFNYSHSCNVGIKRALQYNPKWIVVSNDDMEKVDDVEVLTAELRKKDPEKLNSLFTKPTIYHSFPICIGVPRAIIGRTAEYIYLLSRRNMNTGIFLATKKISKKFGAKWVFASRQELLKKVFYKETRCFILTSAFSIFSGRWVKSVNGEVFDEAYINGVEDWELSLHICNERNSIDFIEYRIGDLIGSTVGDYWGVRNLREVANMVYFDDKISEKTSTDGREN
ncbi:MAG: hypothetical protein M1161_00380 [Candidatus Thermoplasmatota archaeon]|nr:hypothetical protein [Candidatus Thermoplasmatota archaeon]